MSPNSISSQAGVNTITIQFWSFTNYGNKSAVIWNTAGLLIYAAAGLQCRQQGTAGEKKPA